MHGWDAYCATPTRLLCGRYHVHAHAYAHVRAHATCTCNMQQATCNRQHATCTCMQRHAHAHLTTCNAFARRARPIREWPRRGQIALSLSRRRSSERCASVCPSVYPSPSQVSPSCERMSAHAHIGQATVEHFVSRVFDIARPFQSFITSVRLQFSSLSELCPTHPRAPFAAAGRLTRSASIRWYRTVCPSTRALMILQKIDSQSPARPQGFAIENRPTDPQTSERMASYLRARRSKGALLAVHLGIFGYHAFAEPDVPLLEQVSLFFLPSPTSISCSSCPTCSTCQLTCRFSAPRSTHQPPQHALRCTRAEFGDRADLRNQRLLQPVNGPLSVPAPRQVVARDTSDLDGFQMMARPRTSNGGTDMPKGPSNLSCDPTLSSLPDQLLRRHGIKPYLLEAPPVRITARRCAVPHFCFTVLCI